MTAMLAVFMWGYDTIPLPLLQRRCPRPAHAVHTAPVARL